MTSPRNLAPKLDLLVAFDAAARHGSFTAAAGELGLTQSAVSQQIRQLEDWMGMVLFERRPRSILLTPGGREFHHSVALALDHLSAATVRLKSAEQSGIQLATDIAMAHCWLRPRLPALMAAFPDNVFNLTASDAPESLLAPSVDAALLHGDGDWPCHDARFLFAEEVVPVCAPAYIDGNGPIVSLDDLANADLLDLAYENWRWMNWTIWLAEHGASSGRIRRVFQTNSYEALLTAALDGRGVALGWRHGVEEHLLAGRLVVPLPVRVRTGRGYYFVTTFRGANNAAVTRLGDWVAARVAEQAMFDPGGLT